MCAKHSPLWHAVQQLASLPSQINENVVNVEADSVNDGIIDT